MIKKQRSSIIANWSCNRTHPWLTSDSVTCCCSREISREQERFIEQTTGTTAVSVKVNTLLRKLNYLPENSTSQKTSTQISSKKMRMEEALSMGRVITT